MVTVSNGIDTFVIPNGALSVFQKNGFQKVELNEIHVEELPSEKEELQYTDGDVVDGDVVDEDEDAVFLHSIEEKPLSQWSGAEVRKYASLNDIDISSAKSAKEAKAIIKKYFDTVTKEGMDK